MRSYSVALGLLIPSLIHGLLVNPSSPCADQCGNVLDSTSGSEISCEDANYGSAVYGGTFKTCLTCELSSTYVDPSTKFSDLQFGLYNLRFALSWCLFGWENNTSVLETPCLTSFSCGPLEAAFEYDGLNSNASALAYCATMQDHSISTPKCSGCLFETGYTNFLANFVTVLNAACVEQPVSGATISIQGSPFSTIPVNMTTATPAAIGSYTPSTGGLTLSAKIGIAVGAILLLLAVTGFCIVWNGKRRRRKVLAEKAARSGYEWQAKHGATVGESIPEVQAGPFFDSPQSQRPFAAAWGGSHDTISPEEGQPDKFNFSPYQSHYTSPITPIVGPSRVCEWQKDKKAPVEEDVGERIEIVDLGGGAGGWRGNPPPLLHHPGNGRGGPSTLTEDDVKSGRAL